MFFQTVYGCRERFIFQGHSFSPFFGLNNHQREFLASEYALNIDVFPLSEVELHKVFVIVPRLIRFQQFCVVGCAAFGPEDEGSNIAGNFHRVALRYSVLKFT